MENAERVVKTCVQSTWIHKPGHRQLVNAAQTLEKRRVKHVQLAAFHCDKTVNRIADVSFVTHGCAIVLTESWLKTNPNSRRLMLCSFQFPSDGEQFFQFTFLRQFAFDVCNQVFTLLVHLVLRVKQRAAALTALGF